MDLGKSLFQKEIKLKLIFLFLLSIISLDIFASSAVEDFNSLIAKNLIFTQKTLNIETGKSELSSGNIVRSEISLVINIDNPYKERYIINDSNIEIYDFDFDQTRVLSFKDNLGATGQVGINYENKLDLDLNNTYEVEIKLIDPDGGGSATKNFHIKIADVNDPAVVGTPLLSLLEPAKTNSTFQLSQYVSDEDNRSGLGAETITCGLKEVSSVFKLEQDGSLSFQAP